jgi:hypothetical protein
MSTHGGSREKAHITCSRATTTSRAHVKPLQLLISSCLYYQTLYVWYLGTFTSCLYCKTLSACVIWKPLVSYIVPLKSYIIIISYIHHFEISYATSQTHRYDNSSDENFKFPFLKWLFTCIYVNNTLLYSFIKLNGFQFSHISHHIFS